MIFLKSNYQLSVEMRCPSVGTYKSHAVLLAATSPILDLTTAQSFSFYAVFTSFAYSTFKVIILILIILIVIGVLPLLSVLMGLLALTATDTFVQKRLLCSLNTTAGGR